MSAVPSKPPARLVKLTSPLARQLAGRRWFPLWAVLHHRGRRTGQEYAIPVAVLVTPDTFVIGLPWGPKTNWAQNVLAAKGCTIRWRGVDYRVTDPQLVGADVALMAAGRFERVVLSRVAFPAFLQLYR
jgi:deazaflavin-dependent oxidoreductase (nitroreductase family)